MLSKILALSLLTSMSIFACPGGEPIVLNDDCTLYAWQIKCEDDAPISFAELRENLIDGQSAEIGLTNKSEKLTHYIVITHDAETNLPKIKVTEKFTKNETVNTYLGQYGVYRGCNELKKI